METTSTDIAQAQQYLSGFDVMAFAPLGWPGWLQAVVFVLAVALLAYASTHVAKSAMLFAAPAWRARSKEDPASWQWLWRGAAGTFGLGFGALLSGGHTLYTLVGLGAGFACAMIVKVLGDKLATRLGVAPPPPDAL